MSPGRDARIARRDVRGSREYLSEEPRREPGPPPRVLCAVGWEAGCPARDSCREPLGRDTRVGFDFTVLRLLDVSRTYGRRRALNRVSLTAQAGSITALLGPNGAGKSTLLSIASTLLQPTSGEVRYGDEQARQGGAAVRARIGLLAHDLYLYPELTAAENLRFFASVYALSDVERRVGAALARAGLADRGDDAVSGFSRGMRQRLALERALIHDPRLVLLDEPFTGLDEAARNALRARLDTVRASGAIVLLTTHDTVAVAGLTDAAVSLVDGRIAA
jgi:heme exporter protein A